jgi:hypothetical protein
MELKHWKGPVFSATISAVVIWALKEFSEVTMKHLISFLITFSPIIIGFLTFFIHWLIKSFCMSLSFRDGKDETTFHKWLLGNPDCQYRTSGSFEDRVISMIDWRKDKEKKSKTE